MAIPFMSVGARAVFGHPLRSWSALSRGSRQSQTRSAHLAGRQISTKAYDPHSDKSIHKLIHSFTSLRISGASSTEKNPPTLPSVLPQPSLDKVVWRHLPRLFAFEASLYLKKKYLSSEEIELVEQSFAVQMPPIPTEWDEKNQMPKALLINTFPHQLTRKWPYDLSQAYNIKSLFVESKDALFSVLKENVRHQPHVVIIEVHGGPNSLQFGAGKACRIGCL